MKLNAIKTTILIPANNGFHIRMKEKIVPKIPNTNNTPQFLSPYLLTSIANPMAETDRKRMTKPI